MKRFITCYTHIDGTRWTGPDYYADSQEEAEALAMEYPIQPITVIGEHIESFMSKGSDIETRYYRAQNGSIN